MFAIDFFKLCAFFEPKKIILSRPIVKTGKVFPLGTYIGFF